MTTLHWDCETRSTVDLRKTGVYVYAAHPTTEVLMIGFAADDDPVRWFRPGGGGSQELHFDWLLRTADVIAAHNAGFERRMLTDILAPRFGYPVPPLEKWDCTCARARIQALPASLDGALKALGAPVEKDMAGHRLMLQMCKPRRIEEDGTIVWWDDEDRMQRLAAYMVKDVEGERALDKILAPMKPINRSAWLLTERLNDQGVPADMAFVNAARWMAYEAADELDARMKRLTNGRVPKATNVAGLKRWLQEGFDIDCGLDLSEDDEAAEGSLADTDPDAPAPKLDKGRIRELLEDASVPAIAKEALRIRQQAGKTSVRKYQALIERVSADGWVRGNLIYHGPSTGRAAGSGVQMQNMIRDVFPHVEQARDYLVEGPGAEAFEDAFGPPMEVLSRCLRGFMYVPPNMDAELWWADYAAVEARGVAWLAGAETLVNLFASGGKIYEHMASKIYRCAPADIGKDGIERFVGKQVVLGCGYGMGAPKFVAHCYNVGATVIPEETARLAVGTYREENHEIPTLWRGMEDAAKAAIRDPGTPYSAAGGKVKFIKTKAWLKMRLPSGRLLWYCRARLVEKEGPYGMREVIEYDAVNSMTKKWGPEQTWGGKLTENAVQGLCADLLWHAKQNLVDAGFNVLLSVHDEIIALVSDRQAVYGLTMQDMLDIMCRLPEWAAGFPLAAEGKRGKRYSK